MKKRQDRSKQAVLGAQPVGQKLPRIAAEPETYNDRKAAWQIGRIQLVEPYGWHELSLERTQYVRDKLALFEKKTWNEIFVIDKKHNHSIAVGDLGCPIARKWLERNMPDQDYLWTLRFSGPERIWGIFSEGVYQILFWDPQHRIFPTKK